MLGSVKARLNPFILQALKQAASTLKNKRTLENLIGTASLKADSGNFKIKAVKNDLFTFLHLLRAWVRREYTDVPSTTLLLSAGAVIYFINPFDAIPDLLPATGLLDDAAVIGFVLASIKKDIEKFRSWQAGDGFTNLSASA